MKTAARRFVALLVLVGFFGSCTAPTAVPFEGARWRCVLNSQGGSLPFLMEWNGGDSAIIYNGEEALNVTVEQDDREIVFAFPHYDSRIRVRLSADGDELQGQWTRTSGPNSQNVMSFSAKRNAAARFREIDDALAEPGLEEMDFSGTWSVQFESELSPAMATFEQQEDGTLTGTFRTTKGDYRFLAGRADDYMLRLSVFDGAHAFLFQGKGNGADEIRGDFWSRDTWHETWTATRSNSVDLGDPFERTAWVGDVDWSSLKYPDLDLKMRSLDDPAFAGPVRILELYGSWCPNCNDAAVLMNELHNRYAERGLSILGLAFEMTGVIGRDSEQVHRYENLHGIKFPSLLVGREDKAVASEAFPLIDRVHAYPTFIFLDAAGEVRAVYAGFEGPATGARHKELVESFTNLVESLLTEAGV